MKTNVRNFALTCVGAILFSALLLSGIYSGTKETGSNVGGLITIYIIGAATATIVFAGWFRFLNIFDVTNNVSNDPAMTGRIRYLEKQLYGRKYRINTINDLLANAALIMTKKTKLTVGQSFHKTEGYKFQGTIQSVFLNTFGEIRYVGESHESPGMLHIYSEKQLEAGSYADAEKLKLEAEHSTKIANEVLEVELKKEFELV